MTDATTPALTYTIVSNDGAVCAFDREDFLATAARLGHVATGIKAQRGSIALRPELLGQPTFRTLAGPMHDGPGRVRYETIATYAANSI